MHKEVLRSCVREAEADGGAGGILLMSAEREELKRLRRENVGLR